MNDGKTSGSLLMKRVSSLYTQPIYKRSSISVQKESRCGDDVTIAGRHRESYSKL